MIMSVFQTLPTRTITTIKKSDGFLTEPRTSVFFRKYDCINIYIHDVSLCRTVAALIRWKRSEVVDKCDDKGNTPLHYASKAGHDLTVQELTKAKADVNAT